MSDPMKVVIRYGDNGAEREPLSAADLELISKALISYTHNEAGRLSHRETKRCQDMALDFEILSELAEGD